MAYIKQGNYMLACGPLGKDARYREFDSGTKLASFSMRIGFHDKLFDDSGRRKGIYMDVKVWGNRGTLYDYVCCLEKGDVVKVMGELKMDRKPDQDGNDRWYLDPEFVEVQPQIQMEEEEPYHEPDAPTDDAGEDYDAGEFADDDYPEVLQ